LMFQFRWGMVKVFLFSQKKKNKKIKKKNLDLINK